MAKILLLLFIVFLVYLLFRGFLRSQVRKPPPAAEARPGEDMVACARCGVNMPRTAAHEVDGKLVCKDNPQCR